jgi:uncharacterized membrane protein YccC
MLGNRLTSIQRFLYSHHFIGGIRRGAGVILAFCLALLITDDGGQALIAGLGASCVAIIDQPGPLGTRLPEMFGGMILSAIAVSVTGMVSSDQFWLLVAVAAQTFFFSFLVVYGKRGGVIGLSCLILTVITMHSALTPDEVMGHTLTTVLGAATYILVSALASKPFQIREEEQSLSVALFATADYVSARAELYDANTDIDDGYRKLIAKQSKMAEEHQAARDMIMRRMSPQSVADSPRRRMVWNVHIDMVNMLDMLVGTHTDYTLLHRTLGSSDTLIFMRDALLKISMELERIALAVTREKKVLRRNSVKAELRALEYEIELMKRHGFSEQQPESYVLCVQILRRLRNINRCIERMMQQTNMPADAPALHVAQLGSSMTEFLSRQSFRPKLLTSNLRLDSPPFRFALRVTIGVAIGLAIGMAVPQIGAHAYWIVLTIIIILKPAFSLTKQRNNARLIGTLLGCGLAFGILKLTDDPYWLGVILVLSLISTLSLMLLNYLAATIFTTLAVLIGLHFLLPSSLDLANERAIDTIIGSVVAFLCSYILPWWESRSLPSLADAAIRSNQSYLDAGIQRLEAITSSEVKPSPTAWPLARKNMLVAFSNYAEAFYRMMGEPTSHQEHVSEYNNLLLQTHVLATEVATSISLLETQDPPSGAAIFYLQQMSQALKERDLERASQEIKIDDPTLKGADWVFPIKQLQRAVQSIIRESRVLPSVENQIA